ncbi:hypothetical protein CTI12_AA395610 [Artemisia annua]|uniref:Uncharacterized protein n=1 Tax=Artemisia annua TaxID=35608 RepID=A0A2U1MCJ6_ARTAN|nr:hypothetical protein CTI12_AA395610 [Artemisia annua]
MESEIIAHVFCWDVKTAMEISCGPCFRRHVCSIFMDNAVVSTRSTPDGRESIDANLDITAKLADFMLARSIGEIEESRKHMLPQGLQEPTIMQTQRILQEVRFQNKLSSEALREAITSITADAKEKKVRNFTDINCLIIHVYE